MYIIGISSFFHDSAAALIKDGEIISAAQEERFTRIKHDHRFPINSVNYCVSSNNLSIMDIDVIVFYENPVLKFDRLLKTYLNFGPKGLHSYTSFMDKWLNNKINYKDNIIDILSKFFDVHKKKLPTIIFSKHHFSHAASAFFPSQFRDASIICLDGVGEWSTSSVWHGNENQLSLNWQLNFPHSLGLLYSAFTNFIGFKVNSGEYKMMGLAPYGQSKYKKVILDNLIDIKNDGSFALDMDYFDFHIGESMINENFSKLFNFPRRMPEDELKIEHMNIAKSIQEVTDEIVIRIAKNVKKEQPSKNLCLAGGVALNCVTNGKLYKEGLFENIWVQPASGDAGGAIGSALGYFYNDLKKTRIIYKNDPMKGSFLGPQYSDNEIIELLEYYDAEFTHHNEESLLQEVSLILSKGLIVGWFQGKMEFGPRSLGNRSILGDPRNPSLQSIMNLKIKKRESFRPFAPAVLHEEINNYFEKMEESPYMNFVTNIKNNQKIKKIDNDNKLFGIDLLKLQRSKIPSITHVDFSARIQTVKKESNKKFHALITSFFKLTKCPMLINTSFNVRGEPIVASPKDAYHCFMSTDIDYLVLNNFLLSKKDQKPKVDTTFFEVEHELD